MKRLMLLMTLALVGWLSLDATAWAQPMTWGTPGGWGPDGQYTKLYDKASVETITGKVASVDEVTPVSTSTRGVRLMVTTPKEEVSVMLGPSWFVANQDVRIDPGDTVEVTGSRVVIAGRPMIIAQDVVKGDMMMKLRSKDGRPLWSAWSKRQSSSQ